MELSKRQVAQLTRLVELAEKIGVELKQGTSKPKKTAANGSTRIRRSGKELVAFRKLIKSERKKGVPVSELASKHGVSPAYIYQMQ